VDRNCAPSAFTVTPGGTVSDSSVQPPLASVTSPLWCQAKRVSWTNSLPWTDTDPGDASTQAVSVSPAAGADAPVADTRTYGRSPLPVERRPTWSDRAPSCAAAPLLARPVTWPALTQPSVPPSSKEKPAAGAATSTGAGEAVGAGVDATLAGAGSAAGGAV